MALETLSGLLDNLNAALQTASTTLPTAASVLPPHEGLSLLTTKNDLFLSYLQHLVFLILLKLRHSGDYNLPNVAQTAKSSLESPGTALVENPEVSTIRNPGASSVDDALEASIVQKLVELRVYLERGIKPLEGRLRYQLDKVLRAADEATARNATRVPKDRSSLQHPRGTTGSASASDAESDDGSFSDDSDVNELAYRPNISAFVAPAATTRQPNSVQQTSAEPGDEIYRPPRIAPTALPTTLDRTSARSEGRRPQRSALIDNFVATELSSAPLAEPSIGSNLARGGRRQESERGRREADERRRFEEDHLMRLPQLSKKDKKERRGRDKDEWGGEEWAGLGRGADRVLEMTKGSKKRKAIDDTRGSGTRIGQRWEQKVQALESRQKKRRK